MYKVILTNKAKKHLDTFKKSGNQALVRKVDVLLKELALHPTEGTGKPERLKGDLTGCYSRRINHKHRMVYEIENDTVRVFVLSMRGHYSDK